MKVQRVIVEGFINGQWICLVNSPLKESVSPEQVLAAFQTKEFKNRRISEFNVDSFGVVLVKLI